MNDFITIEENVMTELVVQKSKFICNLIKVESQEEAEDIIKKYKKMYHDARHNCVAYRVIKDDMIVEKSSDDGEPSGTAGAPMLNILQKNSLINVVVIVTRYFGGILLGTGGLVRAYSDSLIQCIQESSIIEKTYGEEYEVKLEYNNLESFKYYCKKNNIYIYDLHYTDIILCKIQLEESKKEILLEDYNLKNINLLDLRYLSKKMINKCILK